MPEAGLFLVNVAHQLRKPLRCPLLTVIFLGKAGDECFGALKTGFQPRGNLLERFEGLARHLFRLDSGETGQIVSLADKIDFVLLRRVAKGENITPHRRVMSRQYFIDQFVVARQRRNIHLVDELRDFGKDETVSCIFALLIAR